MGEEILTPTWATWDDFHAEYIPWRKDYEASPASAGKFFSGGEILPDGSTVLEDYTFENIYVDFENEENSKAEIVTEPKIPRSRMDMKKLHEFDARFDKRSDIKGDRAKDSKFYKEYITDVEKAKDEGEEGQKTPWVDTFARLKPQLEEESENVE